jgi:dTDP-glucose pyrophosphorylase/CBS domain-containing protein
MFRQVDVSPVCRPGICNMTVWEKTLLSPGASIRDTIARIDATSYQICLVVDAEGRLLGTVTDGDVRRAILDNVSMEEHVEKIMFRTPKTAVAKDTDELLLALIKKHQVLQIPILDQNRKVCGLVHVDDILKPAIRRGNWIVLMAGGLGKRLSPLTNDAPKPLLHVGDKPILETIIESFVRHNFYRFYISVNYKADMITEYFGTGEKWGVEIRYIREDRPLGTAGALALIKDRPKNPIIVMNGDLLTRVNFNHLLDYHRQKQASATMCVREYDVQVPYGVVRLDGDKIKSIDEKPIHRFFVNAGIYVLNPSLIDIIPKAQPFDMTSLFELTSESNELNSVAFPIREYWLDIGQMDDFNKANWDFDNAFNKSY